MFNALRVKCTIRSLDKICVYLERASSSLVIHLKYIFGSLFSSINLDAHNLEKLIGSSKALQKKNTYFVAKKWKNDVSLVAFEKVDLPHLWHIRKLTIEFWKLRFVVRPIQTRESFCLLKTILFESNTTLKYLLTLYLNNICNYFLRIHLKMYAFHKRSSIWHIFEICKESTIYMLNVLKLKNTPLGLMVHGGLERSRRGCMRI